MRAFRSGMFMRWPEFRQLLRRLSSQPRAAVVGTPIANSVGLVVFVAAGSL